MNKKIILITTFLIVLLIAKGQKQPIPNKILEPIEQELVKNKQINSISETNNFSQKQKTYNKYGYIYSCQYLKHFGVESFSDVDLQRCKFIIVPDTCLRIITGNKNYSTTICGIGLTFDPYSRSYDKNFYDSPIISTPPRPTHGYRLDNIIIKGQYFKGVNNNPNNHDTLRLYICYIQPYSENNLGIDYRLLHHASDKNKDTSLVVPMVTAHNCSSIKGGYVMPAASNTITLDYVMSEKDFSLDRISSFNIPLTSNNITEDGFRVPAGGCISVVMKFIPGYDYKLGDTLCYDEFNDGTSIIINNFFIPDVVCKVKPDGYGGMDILQRAFADPYGFNTTFFEYIQLRYQSFDDFLDSCYYPTSMHLPDIIFDISIDDSIFYDNVIDLNNNIVSKIYPNPATDKIRVCLNDWINNGSIRIYNSLGALMKTMTIHQNTQDISVADLSAGIYIVEINVKDISVRKKLIINR